MPGRRFGALLLGLGLLLAAGCGGDDRNGKGPAGVGGPVGAEGTPNAAPYAGCNVVLISIDTLRADAVSWQGGEPGLTEAFSTLADDAVVFTHARAQAPQTAPSHMSLFTSVLPSVHGVQNVQHGTDPATGVRRPLIQAAPLEIPTLAEVLHGAGYATLGLTDGGNLNPPHGFDRGFDDYTYQLTGAAAQAEEATARLTQLRAADRPFFLFVHTYEVHAPYVAPQEYLDRWAPADYDGPMRERVEEVAKLPFQEAFGAMKSLFWRDKETFGEPESRYLHGVYRAGVEHTDDLFAGFLAQLRASGTLDDSIVIMLSDHGEEFFEHGEWQHDQLYEECLRVPLLVHLPDGRGAGRRIDTPVALIDVMPSLLELLGVQRKAPEGAVDVPMQGVSFAPALLGGGEPRARPIVSEYRADRPGGPLYDWQIAIEYQDRKFIQDQYRQRLWWGEGKAPRDWRDHMLFALDDDPGEGTNLAPGGDPLVANFQGQLRNFLATVQALGNLQRLDAGADLDAEQLDQLIKLGYVGASAAQEVAPAAKDPSSGQH